MKTILMGGWLFLTFLAGTGLGGDLGFWSGKSRLTCSGYDKAEALAEFPLLVRLSPAAASGFSYDQLSDPVSGTDLRFTIDGSNALPREIDTWNTNGESLIWVRLPALASAADSLEMVWGGDFHTGSTIPWDAAALGVWHLGQPNAPDSTTNRFHGQAFGTVTPAAGPLGGACDFVRNASYIDAGSNAVFTFGTNDFTLSAWLESDPIASYEGFMGTYAGSPKGFMFMLNNATNNILDFYCSNAYSPSAAAVPDGQWVHVAYQRAGTNAFYYINGVRVARVAPLPVNAGGSFQIGAGGASWNTYRFDGRLDEVRVDAAARSSNWLWAAWFQAVSNSAFLSFGAAEPQTRPWLSAAAPTNVTPAGACFNAALLSTGASATAVTLYWGAADGGTDGAAWAGTNAFPGHTESAFPAAYTKALALDPGAWYFHRFRAVNAFGEHWAPSGEPVMAGEVTLQVEDAIGSETGKPVLVSLLRPGWSTNLPLTVAYSLGGSAVNGADFSNLAGRITFPAGASQVALRLAPTNDFVYEGSEGVTLALEPGPYALGASNAASLLIEEANKLVYVATNGAAAPPYGSWANAATTIQDAVDFAAVGDTVRVGAGAYTGRGTGAAFTFCVTVDKNIRLESESGPAATLVDAKSVVKQRGLLITNAPNAVVSGFTFRRGRVTGTYDHGGGVFMLGGLLTNCAVRDNYAVGYGGGLYLKAGRVADCVVASNLSVEHSYGAGGGVYMAGGELMDSHILTNECKSSNGAGGIYLADGLVRNCLVAYNIAVRNEDPLYSQGGGIRMTKGSVLHCTIVSNYSENDGGGLYMAGGGATNCIVVDNRVGGAAYPGGLTRNIGRAGGTVSYTCASPLQAGAGNLDASPAFLNPAADFRLGPGSPCRDAALAELAPTRDLAGGARPIDGNGDGEAAPDLGAYEAGPVSAGALACSFSASADRGFNALAVVLTAAVAGAQTNGLYLNWNLNKGREPAMTAEGSGRLAVWTNFAPGWYTVELTVSNGLGETARYEAPDFIRVAPEVVYVATNGGHVFPFATPANAATSVLAAVAVAGDAPGTGTLVRIAAGAYRTPETILVDKGIRLSGDSGPDATLLQTLGNTFRALFVSHPAAFVDGLSVRGPVIGFSNFGGALKLHSGTISNCVFRETKIISQGGAVYMTNGLLTHCVIASNTVTEWQLGYGGGLLLAGGVVQYTLFASNNTLSHRGGGAVYMTGGTLRNCLLTNNAGLYKSAPNYSKGGAISMTGGRIESCTIADNFCEGPGGGVYLTGGAITNTILYFNRVDTRNASTLDNLARVPETAGSVAYSCAFPLPDGAANLHLDPTFLDRPAGNYSLSPASPCVNMGTNLAWMAGAGDFAGDTRIVNAIPDIGAFEAADASAGPLTVTFSTPQSAGYTNLEAVFTASAVGSDSNLTYYWWDFNAGGTPVMQQEGAGLREVTRSFTAGQYSVRLVARNASGEYATNLQERLILVSPAVIYVATNSTPAMPYLSRDTAANSLHEAILAAGGDATNHSLVLVGPGVYSNVSPVNIAKPVDIRSEDGPASTILWHTGGRILYLNHPQATVAGLTLANGQLSGTTQMGAGLLLESGAVSNCIIRDCVNTAKGGGVYMADGLLTDCLIVSNSCTEWQYGYGGGLYVAGGLADRCRVVFNVSRSHRGGGGLYLAGGAVRNTLIARNEARPTATPGSFGDAGGAVVVGGVLGNCTVTFNTAATNCGGVIIEGNAGGVTNCIVAYNRVTNNPALAQDFLNAVRTGFSCSPDLADGVGGNVGAEPGFVSTNEADFRLDRLSPCLETGTNTDWIVQGNLDLEGRPRRLGKRVDMGAYEADAPRAGLLLLIR